MLGRVDNLGFKGHRVIVPRGARTEILKRIHGSHMGINGCIRRARESVFYLSRHHHGHKEYGQSVLTTQSVTVFSNHNRKNHCCLTQHPAVHGRKLVLTFSRSKIMILYSSFYLVFYLLPMSWTSVCY